MKSAIFLTDTGPGIGFGHNIRCQTLAEEMKKHGWNIEYHLFDSSKKEADWLNSGNFFNKRDQLYIVDSYRCENNFFHRLHKNNKIVAIDDYARINYDVDLIINPNCSFNSNLYSDKNTPVIGGTKYVLIRSNFLKKGKRHSLNKLLSSVFVSVGGSDYRNLLKPLCCSLLKYESLKEIHVTAGNEKHKKYLQKQLNNKKIHIYGVLDSEKHSNLMTKADIAVSAAGQTLHELCACGLPFIIIGIDKDQKPNYNFFTKNDISLSSMWWNRHKLSESVIEAIKSANYTKRKKLEKKMISLVDGKGAKRITNILESLI